jgi:hypothetical protein
VSTGYEGSIATYEVTFGFHCVMLRVLHVNRFAGQSQDIKIGSGAFSQIYEKTLISEKFVAKRTAFKYANKFEIEQVIR